MMFHLQPTNIRQLQKLATQHIMDNTTKLCHGCCSSANFEQTSQNPNSWMLPRSNKVQMKDRYRAQSRKMSVTVTFKTEVTSFNTRFSPDRPLHLKRSKNKVWTNFTLDTSSPCNVQRVKLRRSWRQENKILVKSSWLLPVHAKFRGRSMDPFLCP